MDRRTVLAFVLIFLVVIGWDYLYRSMFPPPDAGQAGAGGETSTPEATLNPATEPASIAQPEVGSSAGPDGATDSALYESAEAMTEAATDRSATDGQVERDALQFRPSPTSLEAVQVRTPLYEAVLSLKGARMTSWQEMEFVGPEGGPVQLIPPSDQRAMVGGDALIFRNREINLGGVHYEPEGASSLELGTEDTQSIVLRAETGAGLVVRRIYTFFGGRYDIQQEVEVEVPEGLRSELGDLVRFRLAWVEGIASTEKNKKMEEPSFRSFAKVGEEVHFKKRQHISQREKVREAYEGTVRFAGLQNQYFVIAGIVRDDPAQPVTGSILLDGQADTNQLGWALELPLSGEPVAGGDRASTSLTLYLGPSDIDILKQYGHGLEQIIDLGPMGIFHPLARLILSLMVWLYRWVPNYGLVIIIISVATKIAFYPLTRTSTQSMKKMQDLQPKIKALQEKYKDNRQKLGEATMALYKEHKVNPMSGCLPLLVQSPVFIALFQALRNSIALRQAPFGLWIDDLSQPDALYQWPFSLPFMGQNFNVLPILMALSMWLQTKLTPTTATGSQMAIMNTMLPIMMLVFFYNMPSGLVLYWLVNTVMTIYQTWRIHRAAPTTGGA